MRLIATLALLTLISAPVPASAGDTTRLIRVASPPAMSVADAVRYCEKFADDRQLPGQTYINMAFGSLMGGGLGYLIGSFIGFAGVGLGAGGLYGAVIGYFGGNNAQTAIRAHLIRTCLQNVKTDAPRQATAE